MKRNDEMNKAWLKYFDRNDLGKVPSRELGIARLAFMAGWEAALENKVEINNLLGCTCSAYQLENYGCKCGAAERQAK